MSGDDLTQDLRFVARLSDPELEAVRAYHAEFSHDSGPEFESSATSTTAHLTDAQIIALVSDDASSLVIAQEIGSRRMYDRGASVDRSS